MRGLTKLLLFALIAPVFYITTGCATMVTGDNGLPILTQEELIRPYVKIGRIQVTREVFGADYVISPDIIAWGHAAVRDEAEKMGADAILAAEVTGRTTFYNLFPSTEYRATGFAIKFK